MVDSSWMGTAVLHHPAFSAFIAEEHRNRLHAEAKRRRLVREARHGNEPSRSWYALLGSLVAARRRRSRQVRRPHVVPLAIEIGDTENHGGAAAVMSSPLKILALSGSLSSTWSNSALLRLVAQGAPLSYDVALFESLDDIPHFSLDRDTEPALLAAAALRAKLRDADTLLIATPGYAGELPGALKNGLDWLVGSGELYEKRAVVVERSLRMQGAHVCDSFTVAVSRLRSDETLAMTANTVVARVVHAVTTGSCADLGRPAAAAHSCRTASRDPVDGADAPPVRAALNRQATTTSSKTRRTDKWS